MAFENLSGRLQMAMRRLTGKGALTEKDIDEMLREVRLSLLEADVNLKVIRSFLDNIKEKALGEKILKGLNPGQQVVKIVHEELTEAMGGESVGLTYKVNDLSIFMVVGLQGTGKTTAIGKMGRLIKTEEKKKVMLIAADVYRPAAIDQLVTLGKQIDVFVYEEGTKSAINTVKNGLAYAKENKYEVVIIDTAGRLEIDESMMQELKDIKELVTPDEVLLTVDAMTGQVAANVGLKFHEDLGCTGVIMTKLDGDTRGGAALSIRHIAGIPIKFASSGEKLDSLEAFHPDRMAQRILGMGDVLTLIEETTKNIDEEEAMDLMSKMMSGNYDYNDMLKQFKMIKRMGSISRILGFIPGMGKLRNQMKDIDDSDMKRIEALILSMTPAERKDPRLIKQSSKRRIRIADGSGRSVADVNRLIQSLEQQTQMARQMGNNPNMNMPGGFPQASGQPKKPKGKGRGRFRM